MKNIFKETLFTIILFILKPKKISFNPEILESLENKKPLFSMVLFFILELLIMIYRFFYALLIRGKISNENVIQQILFILYLSLVFSFFSCLSYIFINSLIGKFFSKILKINFSFKNFVKIFCFIWFPYFLIFLINTIISFNFYSFNIFYHINFWIKILLIFWIINILRIILTEIRREKNKSTLLSLLITSPSLIINIFYYGKYLIK